MKRILIISILLLGLVSCTKEPVPFDYEAAQAKLQGTWREVELVDEIIYMYYEFDNFKFSHYRKSKINPNYFVLTDKDLPYELREEGRVYFTNGGYGDFRYEFLDNGNLNIIISGTSKICEKIE